MSFDDGKARGKDRTPLQVPDFPLCYWSSQLFYLRAAIKWRSRSVTRSSGYARGTLPFARPRNYSLRPNSRACYASYKRVCVGGYVIYLEYFFLLIWQPTAHKNPVITRFPHNQAAPYTKEIDKIASAYFCEIFTYILLKCRLCIRINLEIYATYIYTGIIYLFCSRRQDCEVKKSSSKISSASFNDCIVVLGCKWVLYTSFPYSSIWKTLRTSGVASNKVKAPELPWKNLQMQKKYYSLFRDFLSVE